MKTTKIRVNKSAQWAELISKKYKVTVSPLKEHVYVEITGPGFKWRGLTNIGGDNSAFELKVIAVYLYKLAREQLNFKRIKDVNYAEIFGSCFS